MAYPAIVHPFPSTTRSSCAYEIGAFNSTNAIIFIGGLGDGPHTVPYTRAVAEHLASARHDLGYSVFEIRMTSSFSGFGHSSLRADVADISALVRYLRIELGKNKILLLGHSTGCQDCIKYAHHSDAAECAVDGFIIQGPVSDREAMGITMSPSELDAAAAWANSLIRRGKENELMPREMVPTIECPITAYRWWSLACVGGDDDFFSSDIPDIQLSEIWGEIAKPILILHSAEDEYVPPSVDVEACTRKWISKCAPGIASPLSCSIPGANHRVEAEEAQKILTKLVAAFLESI